MKPKRTSTFASGIANFIMPAHLAEIINVRLPVRLMIVSALFELLLACITRVQEHHWLSFDLYVKVTVVMWVFWVVGAVLGFLERQNALLERQNEKLDALLAAGNPLDQNNRVLPAD